MAKTKVLIVDDSELFQAVLAEVLKTDGEIELVGIACNGNEAIDKVRSLKPDVVTMDISMPRMDGFQAIVSIMAHTPVPILVISDIRDSGIAFLALKKGALEVLSKSEIRPENAPEIIRKLKLLSKVKVIRHIRGMQNGETQDTSAPKESQRTKFDRVIAIASSTGGPRALSIFLSSFPENFPGPILIAQHIDHGFISGLVDFMASDCHLKVRQATEGEELSAGTVYISPANRHMVVNESGRIDFVEPGVKDIYHPSCDKLLASVGNVFREKCIGVILTGMGNDGVQGVTEVKKHGGLTIAQDEQSSVIFGMPGAAIDSGCIDRVLPLKEIGPFILSLVKSPCRPSQRQQENLQGMP